MARLYSSNFAQLHNYSGLYAYTVPDDTLLVLRDVCIYGAAAIDTAINVFIQGDEGQTLHWVTIDADTTVSDHWEGRVVLGAGQQLYADVTSGEADITMSGYLLTSP